MCLTKTTDTSLTFLVRHVSDEQRLLHIRWNRQVTDKKCKMRMKLFDKFQVQVKVYNVRRSIAMLYEPGLRR